MILQLSQLEAFVEGRFNKALYLYLGVSAAMLTEDFELTLIRVSLNTFELIIH